MGFFLVKLLGKYNNFSLSTNLCSKFAPPGIKKNFSYQFLYSFINDSIAQLDLQNILLAFL